MKDTARIITTLHCGRGCTYCANKLYLKQAKPLHDWKQLHKYSTLCLTGGEPLMEPERLFAFIDEVRKVRQFKLYLYLSTFAVLDDFIKAVAVADGITWTVHQKCSAFDLIRLTLVQQHINGTKNNRLVLHTGAEDSWAGLVNYAKWSRVTILYMTPTTCDLPSNEDLFMLEDF